MDPKQQHHRPPPPDDDDVGAAAAASARERDAKRPRAEAPAAPNLAPAAATRAAADEEEERWLDRTVAALDVVLARQRLAARRERARARRALAELARACPSAPSDLPWWTGGGGGAGGDDDDDDGGDDDDDDCDFDQPEDGSVWGGGWWRDARGDEARRDRAAKAAAAAAAAAAADPDGGQRGPFGPRHPVLALASALELGRGERDREFLGTLASASRACRAWHWVALRHADRATFSCRAAPADWEGWGAARRALARRDAAFAAAARLAGGGLGGGGSGGGGSSGAGGGCGYRASLRRQAGGAGGCGMLLRAVRVQAADPSDPGVPPRQAATAFDVARLLQRWRGDGGGGGGGGGGLPLRGVEALRLDGAFALADALSSLSRCIPAHPAMFASLVNLEIGRWLSRWEEAREAERSGNGGGSAAPARRRPASLFSHRNFPSLRSLAVTLHRDSNTPLELAHGDPPLLSRLMVSGVEGSGPPGYFECKFTPALWPARQPFCVSTESLTALAPTLRHLWAETIYREQSNGLDDWLRNQHDLPSRIEADAAFAGHYHFAYYTAGHTRQTLPEKHTAPMTRLASGLGPLTRLERLRMDVELDWQPAPLPCSRQEPEDIRDRLLDVRRRAWLLGARDVFQPLAHTLRSLEIKQNYIQRIVDLPNALSLLTALTSLSVRVREIHGVSAVARLEQLRRLELASLEMGEEWHPSLFPKHLAPLVRLESLQLSHAARCLAPVIEQQLPGLKTIMLWGWGVMGVGYAEAYDGSLPPLPAVLRAARARVERGGGDVAFFLVDDEEDRTPPRRLDAAELEAAAVEREREIAAKNEWDSERCHDDVLRFIDESDDEDRALVRAAW